MYYAFIENNKINGVGECRQLTEGVTNFEISEEVYNDIERYIWDGSDVALNPNYEEEQAQKERQRLDALTLTPADVERALYRAKGMDFEDVKDLVKNNQTIDIKALGIELRANLFYRGNPYINTIGNLLGYSSEDMDYLFENKELPEEG